MIINNHLWGAVSDYQVDDECHLLLGPDYNTVSPAYFGVRDERRCGLLISLQWTHGGIVFAPKPRSYSYVLNKKVKRLAMKSALSAKAAAGEIIVIDSIKMDSIKTKDFRAFLNAVKADGKSLVVTPAKDEIVVKSARNIPGVETSMANLINVYDILKAKYLVLDKEALTVIEEVFA